MFRFENEFILYFLLVIPLFIGFYLVLHYRNRKRVSTFGTSSLISKLTSSMSPSRKHFKFSILILALFFLIIAIANPQIGSSLEKGKRKGVDIMFCIDISNSMLAEDIKPSRLEAAKMGISRFIDQLKGDRVGIVIFAGKSFVQLPITTDYAMAKMLAQQISTAHITEQGTDIASAIDLAASSMMPPESDAPERNKINQLTSKVILVISDGEDHFQEAVDMAKRANEHGIIVHTIGIGSSRGEPIPIRSRTGTVTYKKDREGNTVITRLNEVMLQEVAHAGKGIYVHANNASLGLDVISEKIDTMHKSDIEDLIFAQYDSSFQIPLIIAFLLFLIEFILFGTPSKLKKWLSFKQQNFKIKNCVLIFTFIMSSLPIFAQTREEFSSIRAGNKKFDYAEQLQKEAERKLQKGGGLNERDAEKNLEKAKETYTQAEIDYRKAMSETTDYDKANYNLGTALYRNKKYEEAQNYFSKVAENKKVNKKLRAKAYHNLGNTLLQQEKYQESIDAYKNTLKLNPADKDTKYNLEYARQKLYQQEQQNQNNQQDKKDKQEEQEQQSQQSKQDQQEQQQNQEQQGDNSSQEEQQKLQDEKDKKGESDKRQLDALQQNEMKVLEKVRSQEMKQSPKRPQEKDW